MSTRAASVRRAPHAILLLAALAALAATPAAAEPARGVVFHDAGGDRARDEFGRVHHAHEIPEIDGSSTESAGGPHRSD